MQLFSPQIRLSTTISLTLLQGSELTEWGKSVKVAPKEVKFAFSWLWSSFSYPWRAYKIIVEIHTPKNSPHGITVYTSILRRATWHKACSLRYSHWNFGKLFSNVSKEKLAQSGNLGGDELVQSDGRAIRSSEPMVKVQNEI